eukprot:CAMPEP_0175074158 /NCGR_PEP_ID=MMETSP0052_2-20121109/21109_1 /TAXON_ID=51329 ORGANISM="Polytomella parva, Strain SAG 63-3" /NCGR_SAMPLE_ID=MMETSP0052_2 /ASSEMBLY_ACC=CAM_ASM_000194 /LENGTH=229 /DNA_ID=CAMNT_0016342341 /DNA_START=439 /DNA_END=1128 /DNA_ORIENTATION=-
MLFNGSITLSFQFIPLTYLVISITLQYLTNRTLLILPTILGFYVAWFYLRYSFRLPSIPPTVPAGDVSADFAFATFFPSPISIVIAAVSDPLERVFRLRRSLETRAPFSVTTGSGGGGSIALAAAAAVAAAANATTAYPPSSHLHNGLSGGVLTGKAAAVAAEMGVSSDMVAEANRRRERGARALEERLGLKTTPSSGNVAAPPMLQPMPEAAGLGEVGEHEGRSESNV